MKHKTGQDRSQTSTWRQATRAVRGGTWRSEMGETSEALFVNSGYCYEDAETPAARFAGQEPGMTYARTQNPTVMMLEERIALMEGSETCRVQASGMSAMSSVLLAPVGGRSPRDGRAAFGPTLWITQNLLPRFGIETTLVDGRDLDAWKDAIPNTKLFFFETPPTRRWISSISAPSAIWRMSMVSRWRDNAASSALQRPWISAPMWSPIPPPS
jgi:cystathionine gamma-synthase/O-succinylhomoserine sulfhydrylase